jgi:hypothetical protein
LILALCAGGTSEENEKDYENENDFFGAGMSLFRNLSLSSLSFSFVRDREIAGYFGKGERER